MWLKSDERPLCPCGGQTKRLWRTRAVIGDDIPGGYLMENGVKTPTMVYSHSERIRIAKANGWAPMDAFCPLPDTDRDPQGLTNWAVGANARQLEHARILVERAGLTAVATEPQFREVRYFSGEDIVVDAPSLLEYVK